MKPTAPSSIPGRGILVAAGAAVGVLLLLVAWQSGLLLPRVERLSRQLRTAKKPEDRGRAAKALGEMGVAAGDAAPALVAALRDDGRYLTTALIIIPQEHYVAGDAYSALRRIHSPQTVTAIVAALRARKQQVQSGEAQWDRADSQAAKLLSEMGAEIRPAAGDVLEVLEGCRDGEVAKWLVQALAAMRLEPGSAEAARAKEVLPGFCFAGDGAGRTAAMILYRLDPEDSGTVKLYVEAMLSGEPMAPTATLELQERTLPLVIEALGGPLTDAAINQLRSSDKPEVSAALQAALQDDLPARRAAAARAIAARGLATEQLIEALTASLADEHDHVRVAAAIALWQLQKPSSESVPVLLAAVSSTEESAREAAGEFLRQRRPADAWAAPELAKQAAKHSSRAGRIAALETLARMGPPAKDALPQLLELLRADDAGIQSAAAKAVAAIEKK